MNQTAKHTEPITNSKAAAYGYKAYSSSTSEVLYVESSKTGYSYFGARYLPRRQAGYDSGLSVWLSVDPLSDKYPSMSPFMYTAGNPVNLIDRFGLDFINVHTKRKEDAKKDMDSKQKILNKAKKDLNNLKE